MKRSSYVSFSKSIELQRAPMVVWGYDPDGKFVCRLEISGAGIAVYSGKKGGKRIQNVNWERLVKAIEKAE